jgi:hypothetical protein
MSILGGAMFHANLKSRKQSVIGDDLAAARVQMLATESPLPDWGHFYQSHKMGFLSMNHRQNGETADIYSCHIVTTIIVSHSFKQIRK